MSFLGKLLKGVVVGALVGLTGGAFLAFVAPGLASAIGLGVASASGLIQAAMIRGAIYGGLQGAAAGFVKKPTMDTSEVIGRQNIRVDPQALGKWVFGETICGADIVYSEKIEEEAIIHVICAAAHEIDSYGALYLNDELITIVDNAAQGDYLNVLTVYRNYGTLDQAALDIFNSSWPSTANGAGIAHYAFRWNYLSEQAKKKLSGGIPTRITQVVKGCKVYDPRLDSTNGGSGSHRYSDESTWEWSDNWALITAHYLIGHYLNGELVYGVGVDPASEIYWPQVITMANVCDEDQDGKPKYRIGGAFQITQDHESIISQLEAAIGGKVSKFGGQYFIWAPHNDLTPVGTLTDSMIVAEGGINFTPSGPIEGIFNTVQGQFVSPDNLYQLVSYGEISETAAVNEDGKRRLMTQDFTVIQDFEIAQRVSRQLLRRTRFSGTIKVVCTPAFLVLRPFDVIYANIRETNYTNELFRVISMQYSANGAVVVELLEEDASIYDVTLPLGPSLVQLDPGAYDPTQVIQLTGLTLENISVVGVGGESNDGILVTWDDPGGFVAYTEGGVRFGDDPNWYYVRASELTSGTIVPVFPYRFYEIRARHATLEGVVGDWVYASIITGNSTYDRITAIGVSAPQSPKIWVTPNREKGTANIRISASYMQSLSVVPDAFLLFYSVREVPNAFTIRSDIGTKLYIDVQSVVAGDFDTTAAAGSTLTQLKYNYVAGLDIDLSGMWWVALGPDYTEYFKVVETTSNTMLFEPDRQLPFVPSAGNPINVAEIDYADSRVAEFRLLWANGEVIRHDGIRKDVNGYYLQVVERGTEGTVQANQTGQIGNYFPAHGPLTNTVWINVTDFKLVGDEYIYSAEMPLLLPAQIGWASVSCCLARSVENMGQYQYVRSNIVPLTIAGEI